MFSVDNFYNYLNQYFHDNKKDINMKAFTVHGSRQFTDIVKTSHSLLGSVPKRVIGYAAMFDQEPIELQYFEDWINYDPASFPAQDGFVSHSSFHKSLTPQDFVFKHFASVRNPILCHSERNSPDVKLFEQNHFHPVHYFYHGLISRDWFRHWKHYSMEPGTESKRLGMYCRDASGSRTYRLDLLHKLIPFKDDLYYNLQEPIFQIEPQLNMHYQNGPIQYDSDASATIVPEDSKEFDIQLVPETLFDTQKTHLTEKVFKPIVMEQPFIIVGCPNSLEYLKSYGFETFGKLWDESYDKETDPTLRMEKIIDVVKSITSLEEPAYINLMRRARSIAKYNRQRFFSGVFEDVLLEELHTNLETAIADRNEAYETMPGGTWFMYLDKLYNEGKTIPEYIIERNRVIVKYLLTNDPKMGRQLMIKFKHLLD